MSRPRTPCTSSAFWRDPAVGDLVIRSSDGVDFHIHKDILSRSSPFFSTMLTLPQGSDQQGGPAETKPIVETHEDSGVWSNLIPLCYVSHMPCTLLDLPLIRSLLDAARKYQMDPVTDYLRSALLQPALIEKKPLSVYALGSAFGLTDVAQIAAQASLRTPVFFDYVDELDLISVRTYHRIVDYRKRCCAAALYVVSWSGWLGRTTTIWPCLELSCTGTSAKCKKVARTGIFVRQSWATYIDKLERILEYTPDADKVCLPALLDPVAKSAKDCAQCSSTINEHVARFSKALQAEIKNAVSRVVMKD